MQVTSVTSFSVRLLRPSLLKMDKFLIKKDNPNEKPAEKKRKIDSKEANTSSKKYENKRVRTFQAAWLKEFSWAIFDNEKNQMFCSVCRAHPDVADTSSALYKGSSNYRKGALASHHTSVKHRSCEERCKADKDGTVLGHMYEKYVTKLDAVAKNRMQCLFNTAFFVAKEALPFKSFEGLCKLQMKNGVDIGSSYINDKACKSIIEAISSVEMKSINDAVLKSRFVSVLADGSTDASITEQEVVYVRFVGNNGKPCTLFADLVPLKSADAPGVLDAIDKALEGVGISQMSQTEKLVGCNFDGASVMMGIKGGVSALLKQRIPHIISVHCVAHRLELAIMDAVKTVPYLTTFDDTVKSVFKFYYYSPKKRRELKLISEILDEDNAYYSGLQQIRWLSSRHRSLVALEKHLAVTLVHLENTVSSSSKQDSNVARGILKTLKSEKFVKFLYFMLDFTSVLSNLSQSYQRDDLFITDVVLHLEKAMWGLQALKTSVEDKHYYSEFIQNYDQDSAVLSSGKDKAQKIQLVKGKSTDDAVEVSFNKILNETTTYMDQRFGNLQAKPFTFFQVFDHTMWPPWNELNNFGNEEIKGLVDHFELVLSDEEKHQAPLQWADLKLRLNRQRSIKPIEVYSNLLALAPQDLSSILTLVNLMITLSPSTATCERFFSLMNRLKTNLKTNMKQDTLRHLLRVQMSGSVADFDPNPALNHWLASAKTKRHVFSKSKRNPEPDSPQLPGPSSAGRLDRDPNLPFPNLPDDDEGLGEPSNESGSSSEDCD